MMNGAQQVVGGLLAYCFSLIKGGPLKSWQVLFLVYGCISVAFGLFVGYWMPDSPMRAKCWSEEDKRLMVERVRSNQTGIQNRVFKKHQVYEALLDPQCWGYALVQLCTTLPTRYVRQSFSNTRRTLTCYPAASVRIKESSSRVSGSASSRLSYWQWVS